MLKKWFKVLIPEFMMVLLTLALYFGSKWLLVGSDKDEPFIVTFIGICAVIGFSVLVAEVSIFLGATRPIVNDVVTAGFVTGVVAIVAVIAASGNSVIVPIIGGLAIVTFASSFAKGYDLSKFWVVFSYLVQGTAIALPVYLTFS